MKKAFLYLAVVVLGLWGALSLIRGIELLATGNLSSYGAGSLAGSLVMGLLLLLAAWKVLGFARRTDRP